MQNDADAHRSIVRMLGAVLGDVIREQDGEGVFRQIEDVRRASVAFHRENTDAAAQALSDQLQRLSVAEAVRFVHSFTTFLQITNLAEDHIQRRRARAGDERSDTLAGALRMLRQQGVSVHSVVDLLSHGLVAPVITAHPSEVRRKSVLDHQNAIAGDLEALDRATADSERGHAEDDLRRQVSILWRTRLLRNVRVAVDDEIENAVSYFEHSFLPALPLLYAHWQKLLGKGAAEDVGDLPASCASAHGSAATAMAIPMSTAQPCAVRWRASLALRCGFISTKSTPLSRVVTVIALHGRHARAAGVGRSFEGHLAAARRRALPASAHRCLCTRRRDPHRPCRRTSGQDADGQRRGLCRSSRAEG